MILIFVSINSIHAADINDTDSSACFTDNNTIQSTEINQLSNISSNDNSSNETIKNETQLTSPTTSIYYMGSYSAILKDTNDSGLGNKTVTLRINNSNYTAITDSNGVANFNLKLNPGNYKSTIVFAGDDTYESSNFTSNFKVLSTIKANNISKYYKGSKKYSATFFKSDGNYFANRYVKITVNGKLYSLKTNSKGFVSLSVNLKPGSYKIVSLDPLTGYKLTTTFKILSTISSSNLNKVAGDNKKFTAKFFKSNGKVLAKTYVKIKINSKTYKIKTNSYGNVNLFLKKLKPGTYKIISYNKDGLSKKVIVKIFKRKASTKLTSSFYTFRSTDDKEIKIKLSTSLNDDSNYGKVIKIKINGKVYSKKTNDKGIVEFKLPSLKKGIYKVEYTYDGNYYFKSSKSINYVTILNDTSSSLLDIRSTTIFGHAAGTLFKVAYTVDDVPLAKKLVTFTVNGKNYVKTTDYNGIASIAINLNVGNYIMEYKTDDDSFVNGTYGSCDISVIERNECVLIWKVEPHLRILPKLLKYC